MALPFTASMLAMVDWKPTSHDVPTRHETSLNLKLKCVMAMLDHIKYHPWNNRSCFWYYKIFGSIIMRLRALYWHQICQVNKVSDRGSLPDIWRLWHQNQLSQAWINICSPRNAVRVSYPCLRYLILAPQSSYTNVKWCDFSCQRIYIIIYVVYMIADPLFSVGVLSAPSLIPLWYPIK